MHVVAAGNTPGMPRLRRRLQLAESLIDDRDVLLLEDPCIVTESVLTVVIAILRNLINKEQRQHFNALGE